MSPTNRLKLAAETNETARLVIYNIAGSELPMALVVILIHFSLPLYAPENILLKTKKKKIFGTVSIKHFHLNEEKNQNFHLRIQQKQYFVESANVDLFNKGHHYAD